MVGKGSGVVFGVVGGLVGLINDADANELSSSVEPVAPSSVVGGSDFTLHQHSFGPFFFNTLFEGGAAPALDVYHVESSFALGDVGRFADDVSTFVTQVHGRGDPNYFPVESGLVTSIDTATFDGGFPEENFVGDMVREVYDVREDANGVLVGRYDTRDLDASGMAIPLTVELGHSYNIVDIFGPNAITWCRSDANHDGFVNLEDFAILSEHYGRDCSLIAAPEEAYGCYSIDTDGNEFIDGEDVSNFTEDWLESCGPLSMNLPKGRYESVNELSLTNFAPSFLKGEYAAGFDKTARERVASYSKRV